MEQRLGERGEERKGGERMMRIRGKGERLGREEGIRGRDIFDRSVSFPIDHAKFTVEDISVNISLVIYLQPSKDNHTQMKNAIIFPSARQTAKPFLNISSPSADFLCPSLLDAAHYSGKIQL